MAQRELLCPSAACRGELDDKLVCSSCQTPLADWMYSEIKDTRATIEVLCSRGLYWDESNKMLILPLGQTGKTESRVSTQLPASDGLKDFHQHVCRYCAYSPYKYKVEHARQLVDEIRHYPELVPAVKLTAPHVWLQHDTEADTLSWPNPTTPRSRLIYFKEGARYYYTGPPLKMASNGAFAEWLASFKCNTEEDRLVLRGWLLSTLVQPMLPPGGLPMLILCADRPGAGKTATGTLIGDILGGAINMGFKAGWDRDIERQLLDATTRVIVMDNLTPGRGQAAIDIPDMARLATAKNFSTKALYAIGRVEVPNYVLWIGTANRPTLSCELTDRSGVVSIRGGLPPVKEWESTWLRRRDELLADMLYEAVQAWEKNPPYEGEIPTGHRYPEWFRITARLLGRSPVMYPRKTFLVPPIRMAFDALRRQGQVLDDWTPLEEVSELLLGDNFGVLHELGKQTAFTPDIIIREMEKFESGLVLEQRGTTWGVRRCDATTRIP